MHFCCTSSNHKSNIKGDHRCGNNKNNNDSTIIIKLEILSWRIGQADKDRVKVKRMRIGPINTLTIKNNNSCNNMKMIRISSCSKWSGARPKIGFLWKSPLPNNSCVVANRCGLVWDPKAASHESPHNFLFLVMQ